MWQARKNLVLVKPVPKPKMTASGLLHLPEDYKAIAAKKAVDAPDDFWAEVLSVGPDVNDALVHRGAVVQILTDSGDYKGTRRSMFTGVDGPDGTLFVKYPDDFAGGVLDPVQPSQGEHAAE